MSEHLIKNLSKHVLLTEEDKVVIQELFTPKTFRKHQYILQEGEIARYKTFIVSGLTRTYEVDERGQEHVVHFSIEDWWVGDLYSFHSGTPTRFNIDCLEETAVMQITKTNLEVLYQKVPKLERHFRIMMQNAYTASVKRIAATLVKSAAERYREFIHTYPQIRQRVANHQIASYLGITPQSLSRIRGSKVAGVQRQTILTLNQ